MGVLDSKLDLIIKKSHKIGSEYETAAEDSPIADAANLILEYGIKARASDIHLEPREDALVVRFRVDGILQSDDKLPKNLSAPIALHIKNLCNLKTTENRVPQNGMFRFVAAGKVYTLKVSTLPIQDGEKLVVKVLDESKKDLSLQQLGFWGHSLKSLNAAIKQSRGLVIISGPTDSGKTATLYQILNSLNNPDVCISTIEDPVEYKISSINQSQVNLKADVTMADGLCALLRQDANIVMVGDIRDYETADLTTHAALTGRLVFAAINSVKASDYFARMSAMGVEPYLTASVTRTVVNQHLIRKLCPDCKKSYKPNKAEYQAVMAALCIDANLESTQIEQLESMAIDQGVGADSGKTASFTNGVITKMWRAKGCDACGHSGYKGRTTVNEVLVNSESIQHLVMCKAPTNEIRAEAKKEGMVTLKMDAFVKALRGETSVDELLKLARVLN
ncbi:MAG TPA: GspE/PulE family protein [Candidatus Saccharimonadales bacterium]|nr:GspE/PulE family protein [Candidatus Saccharimonadales bacterium]